MPVANRSERLISADCYSLYNPPTFSRFGGTIKSAGMIVARYNSEINRNICWKAATWLVSLIPFFQSIGADQGIKSPPPAAAP